MADTNIISLAVNNVATVVHNIIDSDDDSEDDNEQGCRVDRHLLNMLAAPVQQRRHRIPDYAEKVVPLYIEDDFKMHFRMSRTTVRFLTEEIAEDITNQNRVGRTSIPAFKQLLIVLWLLGNQESFRGISDRFNVAKSTVEACFQRVINALSRLSKRVIVWPTGAKIREITTGFSRLYKFPRVIGAIDGSHIPIKAPCEYPETYVNRKGFHSIHLQAVCDHNMAFTSCFSGYPGSVHDARVYRESDLYASIEAGPHQMMPDDTHIIGDPAYPLQPWLLVPFKDNGHLSRVQRDFNTALSGTRTVIERSFALLKGRFRRLKYLDMNRIDLIPMCIMACCVLHNLCLANEEDVEDMIQAGQEEPEEQPQEVDQDQEQVLPGAAHKRNYIAHILTPDL